MTKISALSDIGTSVASNDTFVLVDVSDPTTPNKKIQQQNLFLIPDGSADTPAVRFLNDTDVGLFRPTTNTLALATGGSERLRIDSSGLVGIGTSAPQNTLQVFPSSPNSDIAHFGRTGGNLRGLIIGTSAVGAVDDAAVNFKAPHSGGSINLWTAGSTRATIDSLGRLLVGTSSARSNFDNATSTTGVLIESASNQSSSLGIVANSNSLASNGGRLILARSEGVTPGSNVLVVNNDKLGIISYQGHDGTEFVEGARIAAEVDGTPGANDMPGRLMFSTTADGASVPTEQLRITSNRFIRLAAGTNGIQFNGDTAAANALDDYEEGTWTPELTFGGANTGIVTPVKRGVYTKVGRLVHVAAELVLTSKGTSTGTAVITGLPFTAAHASYALVVGVAGNLNLASGTLYAGVNTNSAEVRFYVTPPTGAIVIASDTQFTDTTGFRLTGSYYV